MGRLNRNILECKFVQASMDKGLFSLNRNILECKL